MKTRITWAMSSVEDKTGYIIYIGNKSIGWLVKDSSGYWDVEPHGRHGEKILLALCKLWGI